MEKLIYFAPRHAISFNELFCTIEFVEYSTLGTG
jgi:hypothetical protein